MKESETFQQLDNAVGALKVEASVIHDRLNVLEGKIFIQASFLIGLHHHLNSVWKVWTEEPPLNSTNKGKKTTR